MTSAGIRGSHLDQSIDHTGFPYSSLSGSRRIGIALIAFCAMVLLVTACGDRNERFRLVPASESGITFRNVVTPSAEFNILNYMYFYNGGGVAVADFNGDALPDIYFTANQGSNELYLNEGKLRFRNVTETSGTKGLSGWTTGVTTVDINADGRMDIYISYVGDYLIYKGRNQLLINAGNDESGVPRFVDRTTDFGLDLIGFATQAAFLDYDRDGDLDMFMLTHSLHEAGTFGRSSLRKSFHPLAGDKLLRNENGHFVDVTAESGIYGSVLGYGLGVVVSDVNLDGWPDIYVGNDFHENDYLYINRGDGTFAESLEQQMTHTSRFSMGVDCGDINNDGYPDVITMDMLPDDPEILKKSAAEDVYDVYMYKANFGYHHQFARNTLQLNNRDSTFSDIALLAGTFATDWSWSTLLADLDLDGYKDIIVANGIQRRPNDLDFINFIGADSIKYRLEESVTDKDLRYIDRMPSQKLANHIFKNNRDLTFSDQALNWGLREVSYSQGAAYADLDNDGDLDIVFNNLDEAAFVYENKTLHGKLQDNDRSWLQFQFDGADGNRQGIGARILLYDSAGLQMQELYPTRGFQSSVDYILTFGTMRSSVDSVIVIWNNGKTQKLVGVKPGQRIVLHESDAQGQYRFAAWHNSNRLFKTTDLRLPYKHKENGFVEFTREQLIPHMVSREGPAIAVGDVDGDGRDDIFLGGGKWQEASLFTQQVNGDFVRMQQMALSADSVYEDVDAEFFDADGDHDLDLLVVSGGNEFSGKSPNRNPRLYLNDGKGTFSRSDAFRDVFVTGATVALGDVDGDGDTDVFIGGRAIPFNYGKPADSYLLLNEGNGKFADVTDTHAPALRELGLVKHGVWTDIDGDNDKDLVIAAEWSPILIMRNNDGKLSPLPLEGSGLEQSNGWWNAIHPFDADGDGDIDFIAGNLGWNSKLKASPEHPVRMYVADFDRNDSIDQVITHYMKGKEFVLHTRDEIMKQMPSLKKKYLTYESFAKATVTDLFPARELSAARQYVAYTFSSVLVKNLGDGRFHLQHLPVEAQFSTVSAVLSDDFNRDGKPDVMVAGNFYPVNIQLGRYDASYGLLLAGDGAGNFSPVWPDHSGLSLRGEVRHLREITIAGRKYLVAARNNDSVQVVGVR